jgi:hypothetical protein
LPKDRLDYAPLPVTRHARSLFSTIIFEWPSIAEPPISLLALD